MGLKYRLLVAVALIAAASACQGDNETTPTTTRVLPPVSSWAPAPPTTIPPTTQATTAPPATTASPTTEPQTSVIPGTTSPDDTPTVSTIAAVANLNDPAFQAEIAARTEKIHTALMALIRDPSNPERLDDALTLSTVDSTVANDFANVRLEQGTRASENPERATTWYAEPKSVFTTGTDLFIDLCLQDNDDTIDLNTGEVVNQTNETIVVTYQLVLEAEEWRLQALSTDGDGDQLCAF